MKRFLCDCIKVLLVDENPYVALSHFFKGEACTVDWNQHRLSTLLCHNNPKLSLSQSQVIAGMHSAMSLYDMILACAKEYLVNTDNNIVCHYEKILQWNWITAYCGCDVFVTAFLADNAIQKNEQNAHNYLWNVVTEHDSDELHAILNENVVDLHAHLMGSAQTADLCWINIVNHIDDAAKILKDWNYSQYDGLKFANERLMSYKKLAVLGAYIRLYLYETIVGAKEPFFNNGILRNAVKENVPVGSIERELHECVKKITDAIGGYNENGAKYDYAIDDKLFELDHSAESEIFYPLMGERWLMFQTMKKCLTDDDYQLKSLFYIYLLIKSNIRQELLQTNQIVGFENFKRYDDRKEDLLNLLGKETKRFRLQMAVGMHFMSQKNGVFEARIVPCSVDNEKDAEGLAQKQINTIRDYDVLIKKTQDGQKLRPEEWNYNYVIHFIKKKDSIIDLHYRHFAVRKELKLYGKAIEKICLSQNELVNCRIVGVDAAKSELDCRPEVFAHIYRFLSKISFGKRGENGIGRTYHVGEDFWSVVDGLRAVDEVMTFFGMRERDRIGHGLVLGLDVDQYYRDKDYRLVLPRLVLLDNVAWILHLDGVEMPDLLKEFLQGTFADIVNKCNCPEIKDDVYYNSWMLRGDDPELYSDFDKVKLPRNLEDTWLQTAFLENEVAVAARANAEIVKLHYKYLYSKDYKTSLDEKMVVQIPENIRKEFVLTVTKAKEIILDKVRLANVAIECNPTSNCRIGGIAEYEKHPIWRFNNVGIPNGGESSIDVSINTDDMGVFATSIEREYALLTRAKEKQFLRELGDTQKDSILEWVKNVKEMGIKRQFV